MESSTDSPDLLPLTSTRLFSHALRCLAYKLILFTQASA